MPAQMHRKKSKRQSCRQRYKVEKKVREHNRKMKRPNAKLKALNKRKKDPGVPNSCPFKDDVLRKAEERRNQLIEEREKAKARRKENRQKAIESRRNLTKMVNDAEKRGTDFDKKRGESGNGDMQDFNSGKALETSRKAYYKEFKKVVTAADVVLQVLDARDPIGSRCTEVEEAVIGAGTNKRLVLVLNKIDLVPKENVEKWLKYLRNEFPTVAFKASTQDQRDNLSQSKKQFSKLTDSMMRTSKCLGADMLMKLLNNYARNKQIKTALSIGVVGFPNTGKSSVINSLKRSKACNVGSTPGITKQAQEVQLDKHLKLLDSPGVVIATGGTDSATILKNCVRIETLTDPIAPVEAILRRCNKEKLMLHYRIGEYSDVNEFLQLMALRYGRLKKGGVPDTLKAAKTVLKDWTSGKITYYTHPPEQHTLPTHVSSEIVKTMAAEFDIDALLNQEEKTLSSLKVKRPTDMVIETDGFSHGLIGESEDIEMDDSNEVDDEVYDSEDDEWIDEGGYVEDVQDEELAGVTVAMKADAPVVKPSETSLRKNETSKKKLPPTTVDAMKALGQHNKARKHEMKKMKKQQRRADTLSVSLSSTLSESMDLGENGDDYNFETDLKK